MPHMIPLLTTGCAFFRFSFGDHVLLDRHPAKFSLGSGMIFRFAPILFEMRLQYFAESACGGHLPAYWVL